MQLVGFRLTHLYYVDLLIRIMLVLPVIEGSGKERSISGHHEVTVEDHALLLKQIADVRRASEEGQRTIMNEIVAHLEAFQIQKREDTDVACVDGGQEVSIESAGDPDKMDPADPYKGGSTIGSGPGLYGLKLSAFILIFRDNSNGSTPEGPRSLI